ncbi:MAG: hypothetical protein ABL961_12565 [Vicinamibacterales bacterium]
MTPRDRCYTLSPVELFRKARRTDYQQISKDIKKAHARRTRRARAGGDAAALDRRVGQSDKRRSS